MEMNQPPSQIAVCCGSFCSGLLPHHLYKPFWPEPAFPVVTYLWKDLLYRTWRRELFWWKEASSGCPGKILQDGRYSSWVGWWHLTKCQFSLWEAFTFILECLFITHFGGGFVILDMYILLYSLFTLWVVWASFHVARKEKAFEV